LKKQPNKYSEKLSSIKSLFHYLNDDRLHLGLSIFICIFFAAAYSILMVNKYLQLEYFSVDNVYFHSALWKLANLQTPMVYHRYLGQINIFGDHFHPIILIVGFFYRIFPWNQTIYVLMSASYAIGGFFAFLISKKLLKNKWIIYPLLLAYFLYIGTQNAFLFGFHEINLLAPVFFFTIWSLVEKKWKLYILGFILVLLTKESMAVIGIGISIFAWFLGKEYRKVAIKSFVVSILWYLLVTKIIIPYFSGGQFLYGTIQLPNNLNSLTKSFIEPKEKIQTFIVSMFSFGFLPLLNIPALSLVLQDFIVRYVFAIPGNVQYLLTYHYGVALAPMMLLSSILSVSWMEKIKWGKYLILFFTLTTLFGTFYGNFKLSQRAPIFMVFNKGFYQTTQNNKFLWKLIEATPHDGSIMTQNHLGVPFSQYPVYPLSENFKDLEKIKPDYLVYDLRDGQNPNNFFPSTEENWKEIIGEAIESAQYKEYFKDGSLYILKRQ